MPELQRSSTGQSAQLIPEIRAGLAHDGSSNLSAATKDFSLADGRYHRYERRNGSSILSEAATVYRCRDKAMKSLRGRSNAEITLGHRTLHNALLDGMADTMRLERIAERRGGSSPSQGTKHCGCSSIGRTARCQRAGCGIVAHRSLQYCPCSSVGRALAL